MDPNHRHEECPTYAELVWAFIACAVIAGTMLFVAISEIDKSLDKHHRKLATLHKQINNSPCGSVNKKTPPQNY